MALSLKQLKYLRACYRRSAKLSSGASDKRAFLKNADRITRLLEKRNSN